MKHIQLLYLVVLLVSGGCCSGENVLHPRDIVEKYCRFDFEGGRLTSETWSQGAPFVTWEEEAGWDTIVVVAGFEVVSVKEETNTAFVAVNFSVRGRLETAERFVEENRTETVTFQLRQTDKGWRIESPLIAPHVSARRITQHLNNLIGVEKDPSRRARLQVVLEQLEKLSGEEQLPTDKRLGKLA